MCLAVSVGAHHHNNNNNKRKKAFQKNIASEAIPFPHFLELRKLRYHI
jgi:hypothetical protein